METEKTTTSITNKIEEQRFEFVLYVNNNIICQRYFNIFDYNEEFNKDMVRIKDMMDNISGMNNGPYYGLGIIPNYLKKKSMDYLWENYNPYQLDEVKTQTKKGDVFKFQFKVDKETVCESVFPNEFFTFNLRVNVDIREIIPAIMSEIRQSASVKNLYYR